MKALIKYLPLFIVLASQTGCFDSPKQPVMPNWDVQANVPLMDTTYYLSDLIDSVSNPNIGIIDQDGIGDSLYFLMLNNIEQAVSIQDTLKIPVKLLPDTLNIIGSSENSAVVSA